MGRIILLFLAVAWSHSGLQIADPKVRPQGKTKEEHWLQYYGHSETSLITALLNGELKDAELTEVQRDFLSKQVFKLRDQWEERCLDKKARWEIYKEESDQESLAQSRVKKIIDNITKKRHEEDVKKNSYFYQTSVLEIYRSVSEHFAHVFDGINHKRVWRLKWQAAGKENLPTSPSQCEFEKYQIAVLMDRVPTNIPRPLALLQYEINTRYPGSMTQELFATAMAGSRAQMAKLMKEQRATDEKNLAAAKINARALLALDSDPNKKQIWEEIQRRASQVKQELLATMPEAFKSKFDKAYRIEVNFDPAFAKNHKYTIAMVPTLETQSHQWGQALGSIVKTETSDAGRFSEVIGDFTPPRDGKASLDQMYGLWQVGRAESPLAGHVTYEVGNMGGLINTYPEQLVAGAVAGIGRSIIANGLVATLKTAAANAAVAGVIDSGFQVLSGIDDVVFHGRPFTWDGSRTLTATGIGVFGGPLISGAPRLAAAGGVVLGGVGSINEFAQGKPLSGMANAGMGLISIKLAATPTRVSAVTTEEISPYVVPPAKTPPKTGPPIAEPIVPEPPSVPVPVPNGPKGAPHTEPKSAPATEPAKLPKHIEAEPIPPPAAAPSVKKPSEATSGPAVETETPAQGKVVPASHEEPATTAASKPADVEKPAAPVAEPEAPPKFVTDTIIGKKSERSYAASEVRQDNIQRIFSYASESTEKEFWAKGVMLEGADGKLHMRFFSQGTGKVGNNVHHRDTLRHLMDREAERLLEAAANTGSDDLMAQAEPFAQSARSIKVNGRSQAAIDDHALGRSQGFQFTARDEGGQMRVTEFTVDSGITTAQISRGNPLSATKFNQYIARVHESIPPELRTYSVIYIKGLSKLKFDGKIEAPPGTRFKEAIE